MNFYCVNFNVYSQSRSLHSTIPSFSQMVKRHKRSSANGYSKPGHHYILMGLILRYYLAAINLRLDILLFYLLASEHSVRCLYIIIIIMRVYIAPEPGNPVLRRCTVLLSLIQTCFYPAQVSTAKGAYNACCH